MATFVINCSSCITVATSHGRSSSSSSSKSLNLMCFSRIFIFSSRLSRCSNPSGSSSSPITTCSMLEFQLQIQQPCCNVTRRALTSVAIRTVHGSRSSSSSSCHQHNLMCLSAASSFTATAAGCSSSNAACMVSQNYCSVIITIRQQQD